MFFLKRWERKKVSSGEDASSNSSPNPLFRLKDLIFALTLFLLNLVFLWPFFGQNYPYASFSTPVLPLLSQVLDFLSPLSFNQAVGFFVLLSFPLASITWYAFFKRFSSSALLSFLAGLIFLLPWFFLPRFALFWQKGDGIHALGFAILPLIGIILGKFLRAGSFNPFLASFLGVSLISLISPFTLLNLYLFFFVLTCSEMLLGQARIKILRFLVVCLFAQGFSSFWYHPYFLLSLFKSGPGREVFSSFWRLIPISFFTIPILGAFSFLIFDRKPHLQPLFFSFTFSALYLALVAAESFGGYLPFPVPARFFPEFHIGLSFLLAILIIFLISLPKKGLNLGKIHPRLAFAHHSSEIFLTSILTAFLVWPAFSIFSASPIIPFQESPQVLGVQSAWWEISHDGISQFIGYGITFLTTATGFFLKRKIKA